MPIIDDSRSSTAQPSAYIPRVSTPPPAQVPRWDNPPGVTVPDFSALFGGLLAPTAAPAKSGSVDPGGLTLGRLGLSLASSVEQATAPPPPQLGTPQQVLSGNRTQGSGTGFGPSAYGFSGTTGLPELRGKSPYGFQAPMWNALQAAQKAMKAAGLGSFGITDGFRSLQAQYAVKAAKGDLAATPGRSVHGLGLAADLRLTNAQQKWLEKNGAKFGLVRLPSESWHWQLMPSYWKGF